MRMTTAQELEQAVAQRDYARAQFEKAQPGTKLRREWDEDLNWWIGHVSALQGLVGTPAEVK